MRSLSAAAVLALTLSLTACGGDDSGNKAADKAVEKAIESQDGVKSADIDDDSYTVETDEGTISAGKGTALPEKFPEDVPMPGADHTITTAVANGDEMAVMVTVAGEFDFDAEKAAMEAALTDGGYTIENQTRSTSTDLESFSVLASGNGLAVSITAVSSPGEDTQLMYSVSPEL